MTPWPRFPLPSTLSMPTCPPSAQQSHSSLSPPSVLRTSSRGIELEGNGTLSYGVYPHEQSEPSPQEVAAPLKMDPSTLVNLAGWIRPFLPPSYRWLGWGDLKVVGNCPIDAGGFADVWVGELGDRRVVVKSYRCYVSATHIPPYQASHP